MGVGAPNLWLAELWAKLWALVAVHQPWSFGVLGLVLGAVIALVAMLIWRYAIRPFSRAWYLNNRERRVSALNERLKLPIAPFKLAKRQQLIDDLIADPAVHQAIAAEAAASGKPVTAITAKARRYAHEIVPAFSATLYFKIGARLARWTSRSLYRVRVARALQPIAPDASVVFVINHRSNIDYILVTHLIAKSSALSYAVGEWARATGVAQLIRLMGAYFLRRDSGNQLYRRVLSSYVHRATAAGVTQAIFPEGGLSRTGALQPAKLGLLSYMVSDFDPGGARDIVFVPVGLNYDRVLEDRVLTAAANTPAGQRPKFGFDAKVLAGFIGRNIVGRITGRWYRFSYACVSFGPPLSLRDYLAGRGTAQLLDLRALNDADRHVEVAALGRHLIGAVGRTVPALPVSVVAFALAEAGLLARDRRLGQCLTAFELRHAARALMQRLRDAGATVYLPRDDEDYAIDVGRRTLALRRLITETPGILVAATYQVEPGEEPIIAFYANGIAQLLGHSGWHFPAPSQPSDGHAARTAAEPVTSVPAASPATASPPSNL
jgi:glycerol-3-phosphate O-acyltransferase